MRVRTGVDPEYVARSMREREKALGLYRVGVQTMSGRTAEIGFRVGTPRLEVFLDSSCRAEFEQDELRGWLGNPGRQPLIGHGAALAMDRVVDQDGRVAITIPGEVVLWTLLPADVETLRSMVGLIPATAEHESR